MKYPLTFYVKSLAPNVGGEARGPVIRILEEYRTDEGMYQHELLHVKQWATLASLSIPFAYACYALGLYDYFVMAAVIPFAFHTALYRLLPKYRLWAETQAYKEQAKHYSDDRRPQFAAYIATYYNLNITQEDALKGLQ
jgi:hypothetical protein